MASSLKASPEGLERVDRARQRRGWTKTCTARWWQEAHTSRATLRRFWRGERIQRDIFIAICQAVGVMDWSAICTDAQEAIAPTATLPDPAEPGPSPPLGQVDWGEAPDMENFYGRTQELHQLEHWVLADHCKLITIAGIGGIGKTRLALALADRVQHHFEYLIWRSLQTTPTLSHLLASLLARFGQPSCNDIQSDISQVLQQLRQHRCLLILDSLDTVFPNPEETEAYSTFLLRLRSERHQSCVLITSRELLQVMEEWVTPSVQCLLLKGLQPMDALQLLLSQGFTGKEDGLYPLTQRYCGNPLALKMIAAVIRSIFGGNVTAFLDQNALVIGDRLRTVLRQQLTMLSPLERDIVYWLALWQEPMPLNQLQHQLLPAPELDTLVNALAALERRSLLEKQFSTGEPAFTMHPLIITVVSQEFLEKAVGELSQAVQSHTIAPLKVLISHPLGPDPGNEWATHRVLEPLREKLWSLYGPSWPTALAPLLPLLTDPLSPRGGYGDRNLRLLLRQRQEGIDDDHSWTQLRPADLAR